MEKQIKIALAGNPNSGKTTLFNALTGSNQFVGNWPGVTVEKKEGKLKKHDDVSIMDLPGIYSLSPYTLEEVVARNYLIEQRPDAILNIIDGTNLERNLYLTMQLMELDIPMVLALNMMDEVRGNGGTINITSGNDGINTNEDNVSVTTVNGGSVNIQVTGETGEGDGIDALKIANMVTDLEELKQAQQAAREILKADPSLQKAEHKGLRDAVDQLFQTVGETGLN